VPKKKQSSRSTQKCCVNQDGAKCPGNNEGAFFMSETKLKWHYLPAETDLSKRLRLAAEEHKRAKSVVVHWGIQSRQNILKALLKDQEENLHSLLFGKNTCSCGLVLEDDGMTTVLDLVLSNHHRNPVTLEPEFNPHFRGLVGKRLFGLGNQVQTDRFWDNFVVQNVGTMLKGILVVPLSWRLVREEQDSNQTK